MQKTDLTFALIKPEAAGTATEKAIMDMLENAGFQILRRKWIPKPTPTQVASHFEELRTKRPEAFDRNLPHLLAGPVVALEVFHTEGDSVSRLRELCGPTDPKKAAKKTIRGRFGVDSIAKATREGRALRNLIHCSDSKEAAWEETLLWFHQIPITKPRGEFSLVDNQDGDIAQIQCLPGNQLKIKLAQACVPRLEGEIPVSILISAILRWADTYRPDCPKGVEAWPEMRERIKIESI